MKGGAHPSPFAALSFPDSKKVPIYCWVDRESFPVVMAKPSLELTPYDFLHHNRAALTTRPRRLSYWGWSGGAMVLGKLPVPGASYNFDNSRARACCACSRCGWGWFGHFYSHLSFLFFLPLFGRRPDID